MNVHMDGVYRHLHRQEKSSQGEPGVEMDDWEGTQSQGPGERTRLERADAEESLALQCMQVMGIRELRDREGGDR